MHPRPVDIASPVGPAPGAVCVCVYVWGVGARGQPFNSAISVTFGV